MPLILGSCATKSRVEVGSKLRSWLQAIFMLTLSQTACRPADPSAAPGPTSRNRKSDSGEQRHPPPLPVSQSWAAILTACLGQSPHFIHIRLAVRTVHLHQDEVLVCTRRVGVVRGRRRRRKAGPSPWGLCRRALQVWWGLDPREGADGVLVNQGQVGVQRLPRPGVGMGDGGVNGRGG